MWRPGETGRQPHKVRGASAQPLGPTGGPGAQRLAGVGAVSRAPSTPGRPACRAVGLGLPNSPARRREGEAPTSHRQVRRFAQAQADGGGNPRPHSQSRKWRGGQRRQPRLPLLSLSPPSALQVLERRAEGGGAGSGCGNPEGVPFPGLHCCFQAAPAPATEGTVAEGWCAKNVS